jgi:hypothetical protein
MLAIVLKEYMIKGEQTLEDGDPIRLAIEVRCYNRQSRHLTCMALILYNCNDVLQITQPKPCMEPASGVQAEHPTTNPQTLQHLATRTHLPFSIPMTSL